MKKTFFTFLFCTVFVLSISIGCFASELAEATNVALEGMGDILSNTLNSSQTFGKPISVGDFTVIPVISKSVIFGVGTKLEGFDRDAQKDDAGKSERKAKNRIAMGVCGSSRPVALIFIGKNGDFKVTKLNDGFVNQIAKYLAPKIPEMIAKIIKLKMKYFGKKKQKHPIKNVHKKFRKNNKFPKRKAISKHSRSFKGRAYKNSMSREHLMSPRERKVKRAHEKYFKHRKFPKHQILRKDRREEVDCTTKK